MNDKNGSRRCIGNQTNSTTIKGASVVQAPTKNTKIKGNVRIGKYSEEADPRSQTYDNIKDTPAKKTPCRRPHPHQSGYNSQLETQPEQAIETQYEEHQRVDCFGKGCQKESFFDGWGVLPIEHQSPGKPRVPEYVHPHLPMDWTRRPRLPDPPETLSNLKRGIRHPCQITYRKREMETQLDKLTDEHKAFAFPPDTRPFVDNAYYFTDPASSLVENHDLICRDIRMPHFLECAIRPSLLAFNNEKYRFFRERLPMPQKRILNIPGDRTLHWHNWLVRPLRTTYGVSWRKDVKVPVNWFGPVPPHIC